MPADKIHFLPKAGFADRIVRLYHTLRPLRRQQYWYRIWYPLKKIYYRVPKVPASALMAAKSYPIIPLFPLPAFDLYDVAGKTFSIHHISQPYPGKIDWNETRHGMLWAYHLNYFGWLRDKQLTVNDQLALLLDYASDDTLHIGLDAYPTSLRSISWIRFFVQQGVKEDQLNGILYEHCDRLFHFPEYQIQGNHLWENGCALIFAGRYFDEAGFYRLGKKIFLKALEEQILPDGGHIEGSPMYHSLLLSGLLQCIEFTDATQQDGDASFLETMREKASVMLGWLEQVTFGSGNWPQVNDSTDGVAPNLNVLRVFSRQLNIPSHKIPLKESGYRIIRTGCWELFVDVADIRPVWQPGHSHADILNFCLQANGKPLIVDPGITTYETGERRNWERSTTAHNTVSISGKNSSDVWKSFRVGKRARLMQLDESGQTITAAHDGFGANRQATTRTFEIDKNNIIIYDAFETLNNEIIELNLHLHPDICVTRIDDAAFGAENLRITISGAKSIFIKPYEYAAGFNKSITAQCLHIEAITPISITIENITC